MAAQRAMSRDHKAELEQLLFVGALQDACLRRNAPRNLPQIFRNLPRMTDLEHGGCVNPGQQPMSSRSNPDGEMSVHGVTEAGLNAELGGETVESVYTKYRSVRAAMSGR